jgi:hypothetical protein
MPERSVEDYGRVLEDEMNFRNLYVGWSFREKNTFLELRAAELKKRRGKRR